MTPSQPDPLRAAVEAMTATIEMDDDNPYCTYEYTARRGLRAAAPHLLAAIVAEVNELDLEASMKAEGSDVMLIPLRSALARLLATPARAEVEIDEFHGFGDRCGNAGERPRAGTTDAEGGEG